MKPAVYCYGVSDLQMVVGVTCVSCDVNAFASFAACCGVLALLCVQIFAAQGCHGYPPAVPELPWLPANFLGNSLQACPW